MSNRERTAAAINRGDLDELIRQADALAEAGEWEDLVHLRGVCRGAAAERGHQLWPAADRATYLLALDAPAELAVTGFDELGARFLPGPLTEVVASSHTWAELEPHLRDTVVRRSIAYERAVRGDGVDIVDGPHDLPVTVQPWEPEYTVATYTADGGEFPMPPLPELEPTTYGEPAEIEPDPMVEDALRATVEAWISQSNGRVATVSVRGAAAGAVSALGPGDGRWTEVGGPQAMALLAWAAASGGAHGRRRGMAAGRFDAWWAATALVALDWPAPPDELGAALDELGWYVWSADELQGGWRLQLAVEDPAHGRAWAIQAHDEAT